jgi:hypothetical protein
MEGRIPHFWLATINLDLNQLPYSKSGMSAMHLNFQILLLSATQCVSIIFI